MAKVLRRRDAGLDCDFAGRAATEEGILPKATEHAQTAHGMKEIPPDVATEVRAAIRDQVR